MAGASSFWALFSCGEVAGEHPWAAFAEPIEAARPFTVRKAQRRGSSIHTSFLLRFTCATLTLPPSTLPCSTQLLYISPLHAPGGLEIRCLASMQRRIPSPLTESGLGIVGDTKQLFRVSGDQGK